MAWMAWHGMGGTGLSLLIQKQPNSSSPSAQGSLSRRQLPDTIAFVVSGCRNPDLASNVVAANRFAYLLLRLTPLNSRPSWISPPLTAEVRDRRADTGALASASSLTNCPLSLSRCLVVFRSHPSPTRRDHTATRCTRKSGRRRAACLRVGRARRIRHAATCLCPRLDLDTEHLG